MALMQTGTVGSGSPLLAYELHADNVGASGNQRTVRITVKFKVNGGSSSWYGYACNWRAKIQTPYEFVDGPMVQFKGNESWNGSNGYREYSQDITFDSRTTSSIAVRPGFEVSNSHGWSGTVIGPNMGTWQTNTAPYWGSGAGITISGATITNNYIPENTTSLSLSWPKANDNEGDTLTYALNLSTNGGGYGQLRNNGNISDTVKTDGSEGTTYQWYVDACDTSGVWTSKIYSSVITKNTFTPDTLATTSTILSYSVNNTVFAFTCSGARNANGNTTFTKKITCNEVTVYNQTVTGSSFNVTVWRTGTTAPTGPYVKWSDILNIVKSNSYKGTLTFVLTTTNAYGTSKTSNKSISINLQTQPNPVTNQQISTVQTESTSYITVESTGNKYFIPNGSKVTRVKWSAGSGKLGEAIKYEVYIAYGSGGWQKIADVPEGTNYYNHVIPKQTISQTFKYLVRTVCVYNTTLYIDATTAAQTLHYYNGISLTEGTITRTSTSAEIKLYINSLTSIPNVDITGGYMVFDEANVNHPFIQDNFPSIKQGEQAITISGLSDNGRYSIMVSAGDSTYFEDAHASTTVIVGPNSPVFFVNKYGVGIGGNKADSSGVLSVKGISKFYGDMITNGNLEFGANKGLKCNSAIFLRNNSTSTVLSSKNDIIYFRPKGDSDSTNQATLGTDGTLAVSALNITNKSKMPQGHYVHQANASSGTSGFINIAEIKITGTYQNSPIEIDIHQRDRMGTIYLQFQNTNSSDPSVQYLKKSGNIGVYISKSATSTWQLWVQKSEAYDTIDVMDLRKGPHGNMTSITWKNTFGSTVTPTGYITGTDYMDATLAKNVWHNGNWASLRPASRASSGYEKLPSGMIIQWGITSIQCPSGGQANKIITYPIKFPKFCVSAVANVNYNTTLADIAYLDQLLANANMMSSTGQEQIRIVVKNLKETALPSTCALEVSWIALGY